MGVVGDAPERRLPTTPLADALTSARLDPDRPLTWRRTVPMAWEFELLQDGTVLGEMEGEGMPRTAWGECLGRELELRLERPFFGLPTAHTRPPDGSEGEGPTFRGAALSWGRIHTPEGERLRWRRSLLSVYDHLLLDEAGRPVLRLRPSFLRFGRTETRVILGPAAPARPDLPHLVLLTWFLRVQTEPKIGRLFGRRGPRAGRGLPPGELD